MLEIEYSALFSETFPILNHQQAYLVFSLLVVEQQEVESKE